MEQLSDHDITTYVLFLTTIEPYGARMGDDDSDEISKYREPTVRKPQSCQGEALGRTSNATCAVQARQEVKASCTREHYRQPQHWRSTQERPIHQRERHTTQRSRRASTQARRRRG